MSERAAPEPLRVVISGERLREEPYRIFFPLALALGAAGVAPWLLFGAGLTSRWLASFHALTQMQAFMLAFAAGFLLTAVPKRTRSAPASWIEIALVALLLPGVAAAAFLDQLVASQAAYAAALVVIAQFAVRRFFGRASGRRPPASFAAAPVGLAAGVAGAGLLIASTLKGAPAWVLPLGRALVLDGVFLCLVLGVGAFFFALALHGKAAADAPASAEGRRAMAWHALAALGIVASLAVEVLGAPRLGLALRAVLALAVLAPAGALRAPTRPGTNRRLLRLSGVAVPLGLFVAALVPEHRIAAMHLLYVGGFGLMGATVAAHVALGHGGFEAHQQGRPRAIAAFGALFVAAALVRALAVMAPSSYFVSLAVAAGLWLAGALVWSLYLVPKMWVAPAEAEAP